MNKDNLIYPLTTVWNWFLMLFFGVDTNTKTSVKEKSNYEEGFFMFYLRLIIEL